MSPVVFWAGKAKEARSDSPAAADCHCATVPWIETASPTWPTTFAVQPDLRHLELEWAPPLRRLHLLAFGNHNAWRGTVVVGAGSHSTAARGLNFDRARNQGVLHPLLDKISVGSCGGQGQPATSH